MTKQKKNLQNKEIKSFGFIMALVLTLLAVFNAYKGWPFSLYFVFAAIIFLFLVLWVPKALHPVYIIWMKIGFVLNLIMTHLILGVVFYAIIFPLGFIMRIFGHRFLEIKREVELSSYWTDKKSEKQNLDRYKHLY